jgi:SagB-type dehydrogenase family enzyme
MIHLPSPALRGGISLAEALIRRRTIRSFAFRPLSLDQLSELLWACYGVSDARARARTAPSAGALYPLDCYLTAGERGVGGLEAGVYHYLPLEHALATTILGDKRREVALASLSQLWMAEAPIMVIITAEYQRTMGRYRERATRYVLMEVGHAAENLFLQSVAIGLGAGIVGAFNDEAVAGALQLPAQHEPLLIVPVGYPRQ